MITSRFGKVTIEGPCAIVMADFTVIINSLYKALAKEYGDEMAREQIADAGRKAFEYIDDPKEESEQLEEIKALLIGLLAEAEEGEI